MKKSLLFAVFMMSIGPLWSQLELNWEVNFSHFEREYQPLEEFIDLTEGFGAWDYTDFDIDDDIIELTRPLIIPGFEDRPLDFMEGGASGSISLEYDNWPEDLYSVYLIAIALDEFLLSPLNDTNNVDQGHILFYEGDGVLKVEYRNVAFEEELNIGEGALASRINFQIEVNYEELCVEFHYGSAVITPQMMEYFEDNVIVGSLVGWDYEQYVNGNYEVDWMELIGTLSGNPSSPHFQQFLLTPDFYGEPVGLNSIPENGTVYRFCFEQTTSVEELMAVEHNLILYPNPANDLIRIGSDTNVEIREVIVFDQTGRLVMRTLDSGYMDVSSLHPGLYFVGARYAGAEHFQYGKLVKE